MIKFDYSKTEYERICEECMLNEEERIILKARCQSKSALEILNILENKNVPMSSATLSRKIKEIDRKIQKIMIY